MLRDEPLSAGQIADRFAISRPAVSRHLRVLREAGLVRDTADGRRRVYALATAPLDELAGWLERLTRPSGWQHRLDALETEVYRARRERRSDRRARPFPEGDRMSPTPTGRLFGNDLVLTRTFRAPVADVWASLTDPQRTARWFGPWQGDAAPGRRDQGPDGARGGQALDGHDDRRV